MKADGLSFVRDQIRLVDGRTVAQAIEADPWIEEEILRPVFERDERGLPRYRLCYFELARGHAKSLYAAAIATAEARLHDSTDVIIAAGDRDQAAIVLDHLQGFCARNPALGFKVRADELTIRDSRIRVIPSDAPTAWGHGGVKRRFRVIADELTAWRASGEEFWAALASATGKVPDAQTIVLSNAGFGRGESWQWKVRRTAERKSWAHLYSAPGVIASWIEDAWLEQQRDLLPPASYARVIENSWVSETGDFISRAQWRQCIEPGLQPQTRGEPDLVYFAGLDLGLVKDATALAIVHLHPPERRQFVLDQLLVWQGSHKRPLEIEQVERAVLDARERFPGLRVVADPWQLRSPIQRLRQSGVPINEFVFGSKSLAHLSTTLYSAITSEDLVVFSDDALEDEILGLMVVQTPSGWKVDHRAGGYSDRTIAIGMALCEADKHRPPLGGADFDQHYSDLVASRGGETRSLHGGVLSRRF